MYLHAKLGHTQELGYNWTTYVDLMVMQRSCSSLRVSVKRVSPARDEAMMPALDTRESVRVDFPWSTWAITDMFLMLDFLSMIARIWSTVKFTWREVGGGGVQLSNYHQQRLILFIRCGSILYKCQLPFLWGHSRLSYKKKKMKLNPGARSRLHLVLPHWVTAMRKWLSHHPASHCGWEEELCHFTEIIQHIKYLPVYINCRPKYMPCLMSHHNEFPDGA